MVLALGKPLPLVKLPYSLMLALAIIFEYLYKYLGVEPLFTRLEVNLMSISNTYSIERARKDLGYEPRANHDLSEVIRYHRKSSSENAVSPKKYPIVLFNGTNLLFFVIVVLFWLLF